MVVIKGPWPDPPKIPDVRRNHPAGRRRGRRSYCCDCGRMFDPLRVVPDDLLCRECRTARPPDPTLFDVADDETRRDTP